MRKILVTGGAGFIGSALVKRLTGSGHQVTVLDDFSRGRPDRLRDLPVRIMDADVRSPRAVEAAMHGCDLVIHLAYLQGTQTFYAEPRQVLDVAVRGIVNILSACESTGCSHLMLVSSSEAYQVAAEVPTPETVPLTVPDVLNPRYSYGGGKLISEVMSVAWQRTGVLDRLVIARPHNIIGPDMGREHVIPEFAIRMNRLVREHPAGIIPFPVQGTGLETRSFCWIGDCVSQLCLLTGAEANGIFNVGVTDERTIADVAHAVAACYGREIKVEPGVLPAGSPPRRLPDISKICELGWDGPPADFGDAVARTVAWYQANA